MGVKPVLSNHALRNYGKTTHDAGCSGVGDCWCCKTVQAFLECRTNFVPDLDEDCWIVILGQNAAKQNNRGREDNSESQGREERREGPGASEGESGPYGEIGEEDISLDRERKMAGTDTVGPRKGEKRIGTLVGGGDPCSGCSSARV